jgi:hypothetical protein
LEDGCLTGSLRESCRRCLCAFFSCAASGEQACKLWNELGFENAYNNLEGIIEWEGDVVDLNISNSKCYADSERLVQDATVVNRK